MSGPPYLQFKGATYHSILRDGQLVQRVKQAFSGAPVRNSANTVLVVAHVTTTYMASLCYGRVVSAMV